MKLYLITKKKEFYFKKAAINLIISISEMMLIDLSSVGFRMKKEQQANKQECKHLGLSIMTNCLK